MSNRRVAREYEVNVLQNSAYHNTLTVWTAPAAAPTGLFPPEIPSAIVHALAVEARHAETSGSTYTIRYDNDDKGPHLNLDLRVYRRLSGNRFIREVVLPHNHRIDITGASTLPGILAAFGFPTSGSQIPLSDWFSQR